MNWGTRSHVHVDRVACPWLITRFVDSDTEILFVPQSEIERVVNETGAIPFDTHGAELGHHEGLCSFESILKKYELTDLALIRLAQIVHAADVATDIEIDPLARGSEAIACASRTIRRIWRTNSRCTTRFMHDVAWMSHQKDNRFHYSQLNAVMSTSQGRSSGRIHERQPDNDAHRKPLGVGEGE